MKIHFARVLAHLYCLFHWGWFVVWTGTDENNPTMIGVGSGHIGKDDFKIRVVTYPEWKIAIYKGV